MCLDMLKSGSANLKLLGMFQSETSMLDAGREVMESTTKHWIEDVHDSSLDFILNSTI